MTTVARQAVLMFHDVRAKEPASGYAVSAAMLRQVAALATGSGQNGSRRPLVLTFDDGCEGTFRHAPPALAGAAVPAMLFITTDLVGRAGFGDPSMLREWVALGLGIGSHGVTHRPLSLLSVDEARREFATSKARLEDWIGHPIVEFAYPGGNDAPHLHQIGLEEGYRIIYTSRPGFARTDRAVRPRFAIRASTPLAAVRALERGVIPPAMWMDVARWSAKKMVGAGLYRAVRRRLRKGA